MTNRELSKMVMELAASVEELRGELDYVKHRQAEWDRETSLFPDELKSESENYFDIVFPSIVQVLEQDFGISLILYRFTCYGKEQALTIDVLGQGTGERKDAVIIKVETDSDPTSESIRELLETIKQLPNFCLLPAGHTVYGMLAARKIPADVRDEALQQGLYLARINGKSFKVQVPPDFQPKAFGPAQKNGASAKSGASRRRKPAKK